MRILLSFMIVLLVLGIAGFMLTNPDERVDVTVLGTRYTEVSLVNVVFVSFALGAAFVGVIAVIEGASLRLRNRRLDRGGREMEAELLALRTRTAAPAPPAAERAARAALEAAPATLRPAGATTAVALPSAPVYGADDSLGVTADPDDDPYSGGRAV
jgi:hypothetical protein